MAKYVPSLPIKKFYVFSSGKKGVSFYPYFRPKHSSWKNRWRCLHWIWKYPFFSPRKAVYILDSCVTKCPIYTTIKNTEARMPGYIPLVRCPAITARCLKFLFNSFFYIFQPQKCEIYMLYSLFFIFHLPLKILKFFSFFSFQYTTVQLAFNNTTWPNPREGDR